MCNAERQRELCATLALYIQGKRWLFSGFESHLVHSNQQGWFSSVKITRPQAPGCMFPCLKKEKKCVVGVSTQTLTSECCYCTQTMLGDRVYLSVCSHCNKLTCHQENDLIGIIWDQAKCLGSSQWNENLNNLALGHFSFKCRLLWMQTGSQANAVSYRVALTKINVDN